MCSSIERNLGLYVSNASGVKNSEACSFMFITAWLSSSLYVVPPISSSISSPSISPSRSSFISFVCPSLPASLAISSISPSSFPSFSPSPSLSLSPSLSPIFFFFINLIGFGLSGITKLQNNRENIRYVDDFSSNISSAAAFFFGFFSIFLSSFLADS